MELVQIVNETACLAKLRRSVMRGNYADQLIGYPSHFACRRDYSTARLLRCHERFDACRGDERRGPGRWLPDDLHFEQGFANGLQLAQWRLALPVQSRRDRCAAGIVTRCIGQLRDFT